MFVQTQKTPNPNSIKFFPGKKVSLNGSYEILNKNESNNELVRNILSINGVTGIFLSEEFLSVNKKEEINWDDLKHIIISFINEYYAEGKKCIISNTEENNLENDLKEIEKKIVNILESKVRPAVEKDGGDINLKSMKMELLQSSYKGVVQVVQARL